MSIKHKVVLYYRKIFETLIYQKGKINSSRIISYHNVSKEDKYKFQEQIKYVSDHFNCITAEEFIILYESGKLFDEKYCAITFDDGFKETFENGIAVLEKHNISASVFVNLSLFLFSENNDKRLLKTYCEKVFPRLMKSNLICKGLSSDQIFSLINRDYEIGTHTVTHPHLSQCSDKELHYELHEPLSFFKKKFNYQVKSIAYPYGRKRDINTLVTKLVQKAGYTAAFTGISRRISRDKNINKFEFPRTNISLDWSFKYFKACFSGAEDLKDFLCRQY